MESFFEIIERVICGCHATLKISKRLSRNYISSFQVFPLLLHALKTDCAHERFKGWIRSHKIPIPTEGIFVCLIFLNQLLLKESVTPAENPSIAFAHQIVPFPQSLAPEPEIQTLQVIAALESTLGQVLNV